jgi:hypothetical protein
MLSAYSKNELLMDEFHVQVFAGGRVDWDRLDAFLKRNHPARLQLQAQVEKARGKARKSSGK